MIFLDANFFLRFWVAPDTPDNEARNALAASLFDRILAGTEEATTSEAILAEIAFVLTSKRHYNVSPDDAVRLLTQAVQMPGLKFARGQKARYLRAIDIWRNRPSLGFVDALTVAMAEAGGLTLATFDSDFYPFDDLQLWRSENGHRGPEESGDHE